MGNRRWLAWYDSQCFARDAIDPADALVAFALSVLPVAWIAGWAIGAVLA
jgi:hypothetical protein